MTSLPIPDDLSDAALARRVSGGDATALDALFVRHAAPLLRLASRLTGSLADGEDVVQDVFVGLPLALRHYREEGRFDAWLRRVTARTALMALRRISGRQEEQLDATHDRAIRNESPEAAMMIEEAILALPAPLRVVFVLREIEQQTHEEIAALLGIRRGTSEVRFHRAIRQLRVLLRNEP